MKKIMIMVPVYSKQMQYTDNDEKNFKNILTNEYSAVILSSSSILRRSEK